MKRIKNLSLLALVVFIFNACDFGNSKVCFEMSSKTLTEMDMIFPGEDVYLNNCSVDGLAYLWDFGDGTTSELKSPHHTWEEAGDYTITLTVETEKKTNVKEQVITVSPSLYGTWVGEAYTSDMANGIPITFNIVQEGSKIKGDFKYATGSNPGVISSNSTTDMDSVSIICSYVSVFYFDGEEFAFNSLFSFEGTVNESLTEMQGDSFTVGSYTYGNWSATKQ